MIRQWPSDLPPPQRDSWQLTPQDARSKRQSEAGPPGYRRRFSSVARNVAVSLILTRDQRAIFDRFFHDDCAEGSALFHMPDPATDGWRMQTAAGLPLLTGTGQPLLLGAHWLCAWGDDLPAETIVQQVKFQKSFSVVVIP